VWTPSPDDPPRGLLPNLSIGSGTPGRTARGSLVSRPRVSPAEPPLSLIRPRTISAVGDLLGIGANLKKNSSLVVLGEPSGDRLPVPPRARVLFSKHQAYSRRADFARPRDDRGRSRCSGPSRWYLISGAGRTLTLPRAGNRGIADEIFSDRAFSLLIHLVNHCLPARLIKFLRWHSELKTR